MANSLIRDAIFMTGFSVGLCLLYVNRYDIYEAIGMDIPAPASGVEQSHDSKMTLNKFNPFAKTEPPKIETETMVREITRSAGSVVTILKNPQDGQFWTDARVNSGIVHFLIDTGASSVALTPEDARRAGIRERDLVYNVPISTAGGRNMAASVKLESLSVGAITLRDINAIVVPTGLSVSLLGMSYLGQLQKVEASPNALTLRF